MSKTPVTPAAAVPTHVTVTLQISVHPTNYRWSDPSGEAQFNVTLPLSAIAALNVGAMVSPLIEDAKADLTRRVADKLAEEAAKAKEQTGEA